MMRLSNHGFETTSPTDHRPWLWVAGLLSLIYSVLCLAARFTAKWGLLWVDDGILVAGYVAAIFHWGLLYHSLVFGLAVSPISIPMYQLELAARRYFYSRIPWFLAHCLSKLSILVFTRRIFQGDLYRENTIFGIAYLVTIGYGILAILLSSAGCRPGQALMAKMDAVCDANAVRWSTLTALDGLSEAVVLAMPIWFISKNQLQASKKRMVIFVYCFRLIIIGFTIATTYSYITFLTHGHSGIDIAPTVAWQEILLGFSLISASFPCLRSFLWAFMSRGLMTVYGNTTGASSHYTYCPTSQSKSHMQSLSKSQITRNQSTTEEPSLRLRFDHVEYRVNVTADDGPARRSRNKSDKHMIVHQEMSYRVESIKADV